MAKKYDSKYVSMEPHEINHICVRFQTEWNEFVPTPLLYFMLNEMKNMQGRTLRTTLYQILELMGYEDRGKKKRK